MSSIKVTAEQFLDACETGKGWESCQHYCHSEASFSAQAGALADVNTLQGYTEWMRDLFTPVPDGRYEVRSFAVDEDRLGLLARLRFAKWLHGDWSAGFEAFAAREDLPALWDAQ